MIADWAATAMFVVFATALAAKARSPIAFDDFAATLSQFGITRIGKQRLAALVVLLLELTGCLGLVVLGGHPGVRFLLPILLLIGFSVAVGLSSRGGKAAACHCFGTSTELPTVPHLVLNCALAALGAAAALTGAPPGTAGDNILGVGLGVISGVLFVCSADLYAALSVADRPTSAAQKAV